MKQKLFYSLILLFVLSVSGWYYYFSVHLQKELEDTDNRLNIIAEKVNRAQMAKSDYQDMAEKYSQLTKILATVKSKFIRKSEISRVAEILKKFARKYKVALMDFSPAFDKYFEVKDHEKISLLPLALTVKGRYLDIGMFLENWPDLPFYLTQDELVIYRSEENQNELNAEIKASLYIWDE